MEESVKARCSQGLIVMLACALPAQSAHANSHHPPKPSVKVAGISVNQQDFTPGTKVTQMSPINACYGIGGPAFTPQNLTAVGFVHAVSIPADAKTTIDFTTPWASTVNGVIHETERFSKALVPNRGHGVASAFGGANGPNDYYRYIMLPTGYPTSSYIDGRYSFTITIKLRTRTLHASGAITIAC
jgi:hypothetical protein